MAKTRCSNNVLFSKKNRNVYHKVDKFLIGLILSFTITCTVFGQNKKYIDSLTSVYNNLNNDKSKIKLAHSLFKIQIYRDIDIAKKYADEQLKLSKKIKYTKGEGTAYRDLAKYYRYASMPDSARYYFKSGISI